MSFSGYDGQMTYVGPKTDDLVEALRSIADANLAHDTREYLLRAADEIMRLRAQLHSELEVLRTQVEQLQTLLEQ